MKKKLVHKPPNFGYDRSPSHFDSSSLIRKNNSLYDLSTHTLPLDDRLNHLIAGLFLQFSSYPIYSIVILIFLIKST